MEIPGVGVFHSKNQIAGVAFREEFIHITKVNFRSI